MAWGGGAVKKSGPAGGFGPGEAALARNLLQK